MSSAVEDLAEVDIEFFDDSMNSLGLVGSGDLGIPGVFDWTEYTDTLGVPIGARAMEISLVADRTGGNTTNVYFDNVTASISHLRGSDPLPVVNHSFEGVAVPEPTSLVSFAVGGLALLIGKRGSQKS